MTSDTKMKMRLHRLSLIDSMKTVVELEPTMHALAMALHVEYPNIQLSAMRIECYATLDTRTGWKDHVVVAAEGSVLAWLDRMPNDYVEPEQLDDGGWLPIEDAPKDREVLVCGYYWTGGMLPSARPARWNEVRERWEVGQHFQAYGVRATHYQELPEVHHSVRKPVYTKD